MAGAPQPEGFLDGEEAHALDEGAFDLAVVDGRIDGAADVHEHVGAHARVRAGQRVDFHLGHGDPLRKVIEHLPRVRAPDVAEVRGAVEAVGAEVDAVEVGGLGEVGERGVGAAFSAVRVETGVELVAGVLDGVAVEIGGCRGRC